jgi:hypothetical protein
VPKEHAGERMVPGHKFQNKAHSEYMPP